jgi:hypothetical protein
MSQAGGIALLATRLEKEPRRREMATLALAAATD